jgi:hypothetical protein
MTRPGAGRGRGLIGVLVLVILPLLVAYLVFVLALREGGTGGNQRGRGTATVSDCHATGRTFGLLTDCAATDVRLDDGSSAPGEQRLIAVGDRSGRIDVVKQCVASRAFLVTSERCTLYPARFPRSVWWWWTGLLAFPLAIFGYFTVRARADQRHARPSPAPVTGGGETTNEGEPR